ncbi:MAG TPA: OpgC domain-containing protein [Terriglobales bacterium]|nr:OpgC domain-containing protein [Terriglobales bacterium]
MRRRIELDAARGAMLLWMTLTHLPTIISVYANQPFGFVSGAEGFIFLAALFTGRIYSLVAEQNGYPAMASQLWMRALRLYAYHVILLGFAFVVVAHLAAAGNRPALHNLLDFYFAAPKQAVIYGALLIYRPPLLDILPMYITFLLLTPLALAAGKKVGWRLVLGGGFTLWLLAQFGLRQMAFDVVTGITGTDIPLSATGSFDLFAWQFMWLVGLYCGVRWSKNDLPVGSWAKRMLLPAVIIVPILLVLRYSVGRGVELGIFEVWFDKWHLGVVRIVNFAAIAALLIQFQSLLKPLAIRPLVTLGQASLQVFCAHLLFCFIGLAIMGDAALVNGWHEAVLVTTTFVGLFLTSRIFGKKEQKNARRPILGAGRPIPQFGD